ncbi:MAG: hypothetical protein AAF639_04260 [Chloroflexota bacterium]
MERHEAEQILDLMANMRGDLREGLIYQRWWLIWIVAGVEMAITCTVTHLIHAGGERRGWVFAIIWAIHIGLIPLFIALIHRRAGGQRTITERNIWWIWTTFIICSLLTASLNWMMMLPLFGVAPAVSLLSAFAFAMMAMITSRAFLIGSGFFVVVMVAMTLQQDIQFLIYGGAWFVVLVFLGLYFRFMPTLQPTKGTKRL